MSHSSSRHVFEVLRYVSAASEPVSVTDVARALKLPASTAHRALATLEETEYVERYRGSSRVIIGPMVHGLAQAFFARFGLRDLAMPYMRTLALLTGETVSLFVPVGWYAVRIALVRGSNEIIHTGPLGEARRLSDGYASQAILSTFADEQVAEVLRADPACRLRRSREALLRALARVRSQGYAAMDPGVRSGHAAIAVALRGNEPVAVGALAIEGPVVANDGKPLPIEWLRMFAEIETQVRANPERFRNHYAHLSARDIVMDA